MAIRARLHGFYAATVMSRPCHISDTDRGQTVVAGPEQSVESWLGAAYAGGRILPGFIRFARVERLLDCAHGVRAPSPCSATRYRILPTPTPCSPVQVPPMLQRAVRPAVRSGDAASASSCGRSGIDDVEQVKVAVADMADERTGQRRLVQVALRFDDAVGEPRRLARKRRSSSPSRLDAGPARRSTRRGGPATAARVPRSRSPSANPAPTFARPQLLHASPPVRPLPARSTP